MTLNERIQKDLVELYNDGKTPGEIQNALHLDGLIKAEPGMTSFATKALPGYYTGNRKAKTVMVMLNPGVGVYEANSHLMCDLLKRSMKNAADIENYHKWCVNYGHIDKMRLDNFDLKQAFFLHKWKETEIILPEDLSSNPKSDKPILLDAKEAVLTQKLQLELIPYASGSFSCFDKNKIELLFPFVETLFDEILAHKRTYVIFCSRFFKTLFKKYRSIHHNSIIIKDSNPRQIGNSKISGSCSVISVNYNNKHINAIIANTFPNQALPNSFELMEQYGEYCYEQYRNMIMTEI